MVWKNIKIPYLTDPAKEKKMELKGLIESAMRECGVHDLPFFRNHQCVEAVVTFYFRRPAYHIRMSNGVVTVSGNAGSYPISTDNDNNQKYLWDALQGPLYPNDNHIIDVISRKRYLPLNCSLAEYQSQKGLMEVTFRAMP